MTKPKFPLARPKGNQRARKPIIAADIETDGLGGAFIVGAYSVEGEDDIHIFNSPDEWLHIILSRAYEGYTWYAHNGGEYDYKYLLPHIKDSTIEGWDVHPILQGERVIGFKFQRGHHQREIRDSYALIPSSLDKLTQAFAPELRKKDIGLSEGVVFDPSNPDHMDYLRTDVLGLKAALIRVEELLISQFGTKARWTIPATALESWKRSLPPNAVYWRPRPEADALFREAYYGGLVFLTTNQRTMDCVGLDVNSMYPAMMLKYGVPTGNVTYTTTEYDDRPGFYRVRAHVPDSVIISPLPKRARNSGILWPTGEYETAVTSDEILYARSIGCQVDVIEGYAIERIEYVFTDFVQKCRSLRLNEPRGSPLHEMAKLMQNSLYGKFGTRPVVNRYTISSTWPEGMIPQIDPKTGFPVDNLYYAVEQLDAPYLLPHWAAWVTAHARITLHQGIMAVGEGALYGDTDSLKVTREAFDRIVADKLLELDDREYGAWKHEDDYLWFQPVAPKNYVWAKARDNVVELGGRAKGISRKVYNPIAHLYATHDKVTVAYPGANATRRMLIDATLSPMEDRTRSYSQLSNAAGWRVLDAGRVRPRTLTANEEA